MSVLIGDDRAFIGGMPSRRDLSDIGFLNPSRHSEVVAAPIEDREDVQVDTPVPTWPEGSSCPPHPFPHRHHVTYVLPKSDGGDTAQGTVESMDAIASSDYKAGWWWVVGRAGTYADQQCEISDMVFALHDKDGAYNKDDFAVVQANHDTISALDIDLIMNN